MALKVLGVLFLSAGLWLLWFGGAQYLAARSPFPPGSQLADYALREFDGQPEYDPLIERLREMDDFVQSQARGHRR